MPGPRPVHPRYPAGSRVRIRDFWPPVHHRVPAYAKGKTGTVERVCGAFPEPEMVAIMRPTLDLPIYRVRLRQTDLWPDYAGPADDTVEIEIFEHWLEPAP